MEKSVILSIVEEIKQNPQNEYVLFGENKEMYLGSSQYLISYENDYIKGEHRKDKHKEYMSYESVTKIVEVLPNDTSYCRVEM